MNRIDPDSNFCPECGHEIDSDTVYTSVDTFDINQPQILVGSCLNDDCDTVDDVSLGYL